MKLTPLLFLLPSVTLAQAAVRKTPDSICSLQLRDKSSTTSLERTNDWTIVPWTSKTLWPTANFFLSSNGELYGGNGESCSFSPYLKCVSTRTATTASNLRIIQNGSLSLDNSMGFWTCPDPDGDAHHSEAAPLIFPPRGWLSRDDEPDYTRCNATLLSTDSCLKPEDFRINPQTVVLGGAASVQQQAVTGEAARSIFMVQSIALVAASSIMWIWCVI